MTRTLLKAPCEAYTDHGRCHGKVWMTVESGGIIEGECEQCRTAFGIPSMKARPELREQHRIDHAGLPARFTQKFVEDDANRLALEQIRSWVQTGAEVPGPAFYGLPGRGKTHLLVVMCLRLIRMGRTVQYHSARSLLRRLQAFDSDARDVWQRAASVDVLALDDVGSEQATDWRSDQVADLIDTRYENERLILVATNYHPGTWRDRFDERTASRLRGMVFPVQLDGLDRRDVNSQQPVGVGQ